MTDAERLASEAMKLSEEERAELALALLESLETPDPHAHLNDAELRSLIEKRVQDLRSGRVQGVTWDEMERRLQSRRGR